MVQVSACRAKERITKHSEGACISHENIHRLPVGDCFDLGLLGNSDRLDDGSRLAVRCVDPNG